MRGVYHYTSRIFVPKTSGPQPRRPFNSGSPAAPQVGAAFIPTREHRPTAQPQSNVALGSRGEPNPTTLGNIGAKHQNHGHISVIELENRPAPPTSLVSRIIAEGSLVFRSTMPLMRMIHTRKSKRFFRNQAKQRSKPCEGSALSANQRFTSAKLPQ